MVQNAGSLGVQVVGWEGRSIYLYLSFDVREIANNQNGVGFNRI